MPLSLAALALGAAPTAAATVAGSPRRFPDPRLVTQEGKEVRFYDDLVRGRVVMVNFAYTRCTGKCPLSTARLVEVQRLLGQRFGRDVFHLTISLDPERDTPEAMRRYMAAHGGRPGWIWLTGAREDIDGIRRFLGVADRDPAVDADRARHTGLVLLGDDRTGRWSSMPAQVRPELILEALLRTAGERPPRQILTRACSP
ncbi:MAG TPA: SCO family protein [Anaeromyxobacteraceae bacterium]|nr:SCO family protein [Anaeromyxobacteraceae bacterium]